MAWIITKDNLFHASDSTEARLGMKSEVGVRSHKWDEIIAKNPKAETFAFRMLDDDGEVYYEGKSTVADSFAPLDDFGMPNAGCTEIQYRNGDNHSWEGL